ncbi:MAG: hybrid sensor histidine kinase/response regulator [Anaerolineae bacterium]
MLELARALASAKTPYAVGDALISAVTGLLVPQSVRVALCTEPCNASPYALWMWPGAGGTAIAETCPSETFPQLGPEAPSEVWCGVLDADRPLTGPLSTEGICHTHVAIRVDERARGLLSVRAVDLASAWQATLALMAHLAASALSRLWSATECRRLSEEVTTAQAVIARLDERLARTEGLACIGELVSGVAHELNNPLTSVLGYAELLQTLSVSDALKSDLEIIRNEATRCRVIVKNLLSLARRQQPDLVPIQINDLIQRTLELKAYPLRMDNICVVSSLKPDLPLVLVNAYSIQQVLLNLANNAHEAMSPRQRGILRISSEEVCLDRRQMVRVAISDDGPGIPPELRERIFESFFTTKHTGTGLGLAISRKIVSECGGRLDIDEEYTGGARFVLDLPVANIPSPLFLQEDVAALCEEAPNTCSVLIVDDEPGVVDLMRRVLTDAGYHVEHAFNGDQALGKLAAESFDLVLLDLRMPGSGGQVVYRQILERSPHQAARVIFTTGDIASAATLEWLAETGCPVLEKPFNVLELSRRVKDALLLNHE